MVANLQRFRSWFLFLVFTMTVAACGGGDGGGPSPTVTPQPDDRTPASFTFTSATDVSLGATVDSNSVTIDDISVSVAVTITDGEYSINNGAFSSSEGVISEGDTLTLRGVASSEFSSDVIVGVTVGTVTETFTITSVAQDTTPEPFAFAARTEVPLEALLESEEAITVSGINDESPISITGGEYAIGEGDFTSVDGSVANGESVKVRLTSSSNFSTATTATLNIGGVTGDFKVTTLAADTTPEAFSFTSVADVSLSATAESEAVTIEGINTAAPVSIQNGEYKIGDGSFTSDAGTIENGQSIQIRTTAAGTFSTAVVSTLNVGGVEATYTATTVAQDITPDDFGFTAVDQAPLDSAIGSSAATITGITGSVPISVQNGWYRIDSGASTTEIGTIINGQTVIVSGESASEFETETVVTLTVGNVIRTFSITTAERDIVPDDFSFSTETGAELDTQYESEVKTISGINDTANISVTNGEYRIDGGAYTSANGTIENGQEVQVRTTSSSAADTEVQAMLTVGGLARVYSVTTMADEEAPTASIAFPPPSSLTEGTTITVRGTASDNLSDVTSVTVKGGATDAVATSTDDFATWEAVVTLTADSVNSLSVSATDSADNTGNDLAEVSVKQDATLSDFPDSAVPFTLPKAIEVFSDGERALVGEWGDLIEGTPYKIFMVNLLTGERSEFVDGVIDADATQNYWTPTGIALDEDNDTFWVADFGQSVIFQSSIASPGLTVLASHNVPVGMTAAWGGIRDLDYNSGELVVSSQNGLTTIDTVSGVRTTLSSDNAGVPDTSVPHDTITGLAWNSSDEVFYMSDSRMSQILSVDTNNNGARTIVSSSSGPDAEPPLLEVSNTFNLAHISYDNVESIIYVNQGVDSKILTVDPDTGNRAELTTNTFPNAVNAPQQAEDISFSEGDEYLYWLDSGRDAILAVDIVTGERVFISKASTED